MKAKLLDLPSSPGVYLMKDALGGVIYVGKSKNLKQRVQSYFYNSKTHSNKVKRMVSSIKDLEYRVTDTEFEAFMLECRLIHELKPVYNKKMKNPLAYHFIVIRFNKGLRRIEVTNHPDDTENLNCFGPYTANKRTIEKAVQGFQECYKIACNQSVSGHSPCLNHSLGLCIGTCLGGEPVKEYDRILDRFVALLDGRDHGLYSELEQRMATAAEQFDFEAAAKYRDCLDTVTFLLNKEKMIVFTEESRNILLVEPLGESTVKCFLIKRNHVLFSGKYKIEDVSADRLVNEVSGLITTRFRQEEGEILHNEVTRDEIDEAQIIYSYVHGRPDRYALIPDEWVENGETDKIECTLKTLVNELVSQLKSHLHMEGTSAHESLSQ